MHRVTFNGTSRNVWWKFMLVYQLPSSSSLNNKYSRWFEFEKQKNWRVSSKVVGVVFCGTLPALVESVNQEMWYRFILFPLQLNSGNFMQPSWKLEATERTSVIQFSVFKLNWLHSYTRFNVVLFNSSWMHRAVVMNFDSIKWITSLQNDKKTVYWCLFSELVFAVITRFAIEILWHKYAIRVRENASQNLPACFKSNQINILALKCVCPSLEQIRINNS